MSKAEYKAAAKQKFAAILGAIEAGLAGIAQVEAEAAKAAARFEVQIGMALDTARDEFLAAKAAKVSLKDTAGIKTDDWREYGRTVLPGKSNQTIYRWQNAGVVAKVLGELLVPGTLVGALVPLYRALSSAKTDEERAASEDLVRDVYSEAVEAASDPESEDLVAPVESDILARCEVAFPSNRSGGGSKSEKSNEPTEPTDDDEPTDDEESRRESGESLVVVEAAKVEAASGPVDSIMRGLIAEHDVTREVLVGIMLATLRLAGEWGSHTIEAVIGSGSHRASDEPTDESDTPTDES